MRLTGRAVEVYQSLEPLYNDYRKLRRRMPDGTYSLTRMDEFIDECLREDYLLDIALPHLPRRPRNRSTSRPNRSASSSTNRTTASGSQPPSSLSTTRRMDC